MITLQTMSAAHIPQIAELEKRCFSAPWSEKSLISELENLLSLWLVALDGETVAGYVGAQTVLYEADMMNLAVHPDYRRQGIARALVLRLVELLRGGGTHCLTLEVRQSNLPALELYRSMGFVQSGCRPNYYEKPKEHALILRKEWTV